MVWSASPWRHWGENILAFGQRVWVNCDLYRVFPPVPNGHIFSHHSYTFIYSLYTIVFCCGILWPSLPPTPSEFTNAPFKDNLICEWAMYRVVRKPKCHASAQREHTPFGFRQDEKTYIYIYCSIVQTLEVITYLCYLRFIRARFKPCYIWLFFV